MRHSAIGQRAYDNWQAIPEPLRIPLMCYNGIAILQGLKAHGEQLAAESRTSTLTPLKRNPPARAAP